LATRALVQMQRQARAGEVLEVRALVQHAMETGHRVDSGGQLIARNLIRRFECRFAGELVLGVDLHAAVSANPLVAFPLRASRSGTLEFLWQGDQGFEHRESVPLSVT
jgi:sulfur-oxidizing protein SoxZ